MLPAISRQSTMQRLSQRLWTFAGMLLSALVLLAGLGTRDAVAATCFAVDDDTARIVVFDRDPPVNIRFNAQITDGIGGPAIVAERIESAYFDSVQNRYYVIVQDTPNRFGYIDAFTGGFITVAASMGTTVTPTARTVGSGNGATGIRGLTRNPATGRWYINDQNGYIYEINPTTGQYVPGSFGGADYIRVSGPTGNFYTNVEDLAFDSAGLLYVIRNDVGAEQLLRDVSLITGRAAATANPNIDEAEGLALTDGTMRLIVGASGGANARNFYALDTSTGATSLIFNLPSPSGTPADYEAQGCNDSFPRADLAIRKTVTPAAVAPGGTLTYVIQLENQGIDPAYRVQVTDALEAGMSFSSYTIDPSCTVCSFDSGTGVWTVDKIDIGQRRTLTLVVSTAGVPPNTFVTNRAQVTQSCDSATGGCVALADFDSTPNNKAGSWSATEDDEATAGALVTIQPSVGKYFSPTTGLAGVTTTLVLTLTNANSSTAATLTATFTDTYPASMVNYSTPAAATSCAGGAGAAAAAGGNTVTLATGAVIPAGGTCSISVVVTAPSVGVYTNTVSVGALTVTVAGVNLTNAVGSTAQYQVTPANVNVIKDFTPDGIRPNGSSTLQITFSNPTGVTATFTNGFTDDYPSGLVNYATPAAATSCAGSGGPTASGGGTSVSLPNTRAIPPAGSCTITVVVTSATLGTYSNTIPTGSVTTSVGSNLGTATGVLLVAAPSVSKQFSPTSVNTGTTSTLVVTFTNPLNTTATFTQTFTDLYPISSTSAGTLVNRTTPAATDNCPGGNVTATSGMRTFTMPVGTQIPPLSTCFVSVVVAATPIASMTGTFVNTVPAGSLTTTLGSNSIGTTATLTVSTLANLRVTKVASVSSGTPGTTISYTVTIANLGPSAITGGSFTDTLAGLTLVAPITVTWVGGGAGATNSATAIVTTTTSIGATIALLSRPAGDRYVQILIRALPSATSGYVTNTAAAVVPVGAQDSNLLNNTASVAVYISPTANLQVAKDNGVTTVFAGSQTVYTLTFVNSGPSDASGTVIRDASVTGLNCTALTCNTAGGASCGSITVPALQGGHPIPTFPASSTVTVLLTCGVTATGF
jgi:uncharacterized repeat protein (TIGR01451 family)